MNNNIAASVALVLGVGHIAQVSALTLTFGNNPGYTNPANTLQGFTAGTEFHVLTPYATSAGNADKDVIFGGEQWIFEGVSSGSRLMGVANTDTNAGAGTNRAPLTSGISGFPVAETAGAVDTITQNPFFLVTSAPFSMGAPTAGNILGQVFGAAVIDAGGTDGFTQAGTFSIVMPVVHVQWAGTIFIVGGDPNPSPVDNDTCAPGGPCGGPGVMFEGATNGAGGFTLSASYAMTRDEVGIQSFNNNILEWSLQGTYQTGVVPLPAAAWLFGSGLLALTGAVRRRRKAWLRHQAGIISIAEVGTVCPAGGMLNHVRRHCAYATNKRTSRS